MEKDEKDEQKSNEIMKDFDISVEIINSDECFAVVYNKINNTFKYYVFVILI
jgi:hypothetical protein